MGTREILLILVLPILVFMIFSSFKMIDQKLQEKKLSKRSSIFYKYGVILCPLLAFIVLKLQK
ncbi:hypothetical protein [Arachidicoccus ginsenosidivorans]|jgi:hypothetical protein|uniref:hypothetical protein n=1 Tax=Arachidicoccus ginsenosidivorans TaxID=496057 RepID=UPI0013159027|nr:hypothetical protein [Arachidicoccus ginsenosidivorans]